VVLVSSAPIADALLARGDDVLVLDDLASGRAERLDPQVPLYKVSITDAAALNHEVATFSPELICHLAAQIDVRASVDAPAADTGVNIYVGDAVRAFLAAGDSGARAPGTSAPASR
jgi:UDP-glucose 4-epimerase